ncbi:DNA/RNA nuclease SfsA [Candidatus Bipolaricaulota bacterium]|nr:DNA/RNA nuclease SfsA [Candidatus Bipolaricaulota bacterium]
MTEPSLGRFDLFTAGVVERDSRVTVLASTGNQKFRGHLRNTGRLEDLIYPGATVVCKWKKSGKTDARVIGAVNDGSYVLLDTNIQEKFFGEILKDGALEWCPSEREIISQVSFEEKRFDFGVKTKEGMGYIELKSAVTCENGWASYPDAPSKRGLEHVKLLEKLSLSGHPAYVVFIVTHPDCDRFRPNGKIQPEMVNQLRSARRAGVKVFGIKMILTEDGEILLEDRDVPVSLEY